MSLPQIKISAFPIQSINLFSTRDRLFAKQSSKISKHQKYEPTLKGFKEAINKRLTNQPDRKLLVSVLQDQYKSILKDDDFNLVNKNIERLLKNNTFTVTTAHQPVLFGGPMYTLYKIASTINLSLQLNDAFPHHHIIPVYIIGSEDHDFDEMKSINLYGKSITWNNDEGGSVGRMTNTGVIQAIEELKLILRDNKHDNEIISILEESFDENNLYATGYQKFIYKLFKKYDLLILNMDEPKLKSNFSTIIKEELIHQPSKKKVLELQASLSNDDIESQVYPRDINLFYNSNGERKRIILENDYYKIIDSDLKFSKADILKELEDYPEKFSPNVILRPVYQEYTLPNLAYIGGGGEIAYWIEEVNVFKHFDVSYPILLRRNSALWIQNKERQQMIASKWSLNQLFEPISILKRNYLLSQNATIDPSSYINSLNKIFNEIKQISEKENINLENFIDAQNTKSIQQISQVINKLERSIKQKFDIQLKRLEKTHNSLFPNNKLQERNNNFIPLFSVWGYQLIDILVENMNPLDFSFIAFIEEE